MIVAEETALTLTEYAHVPISFETRAAMLVTPTQGSHEFAFAERLLDAPVAKDYDEIDGEGPASWPRRFDLSEWRFFGAYAAGRRVGSAALVMRSPEIEMLEGRDDLAVLWDIRVAPDARRSGVGRALLASVERTALARGATTLKVETQDVNLAACRFYMRHGFKLGAANPHVYPEFPHETQLLWYKLLVAE